MIDFLKKLFNKEPKVQTIEITSRFDLLNRVGQGSMSAVWRAVDSLSGKMVALKILDRIKTQRFEARFPKKLEKPTEGEVAVQLRHPNIVKTHEFGRTANDEQFLVMDFVEGAGLSVYVDLQNEVMRTNRMNWILQLGEAIRYFHKSGWIHRDICPRNVMIDKEMNLKLIDFGLVVPNTPPFRAPGNRTGTASYMAPELIKRQKTDQRIDVFSYAVTCYEMYANHLPWEAGRTLEVVLQNINKRPKDIRDYATDIDDEIAEIIMRGLEKHPDDRWPSVDAMLDAYREAS